MIVNFSAFTRLAVLSVVLSIPFLFRYKTFYQKNGKSCIRNFLVHSPADGCVHLTFQKGLQSSDRIYWGNVVTKYWVLEQKKVSFLKYFHQPESYQLRDACFQNRLILSVSYWKFPKTLRLGRVMRPKAVAGRATTLAAAATPSAPPPSSAAAGASVGRQPSHRKERPVCLVRICDQAVWRSSSENSKKDSCVN